MVDEPLARRAKGCDNVRAWLAVMGGSAAGIAGIICLASPAAVAEPMPAPVPAPVTVTQTITVAPGAPLAAPQATSAPLATAPSAGSAPVAGAPAASINQQAGLAPAVPSATPVTPTLVPATSGTLNDYLKSKNVKLEPQRAQGFQAFNITLPMPPGWSQVPDPNVPDAFAVIANRTSPDLYTPNAQVVVYRLLGDFDPKEAITHGFIDSQSLAAWQTTDASLADFYGSPSSIIEGTYRQNDMTLNASRRHVIAMSGPDRYLVSLSVTSMANSQGATAAADATDAIVNGFKVAPATPAAPPPLTP
jgi:Probable lipoprotein LpqN